MIRATELQGKQKMKVQQLLMKKKINMAGREFMKVTKESQGTGYPGQKITSIENSD